MDQELHIGKIEASIEVWIGKEVVYGFIERVSISIGISVCENGMCESVVVCPLLEIRYGRRAGVGFSDECDYGESIVFVFVVPRFQRGCFRATCASPECCRDQKNRIVAEIGERYGFSILIHKREVSGDISNGIPCGLCITWIGIVPTNIGHF